jgi:hypothetical protein
MQECRNAGTEECKAEMQEWRMRTDGRIYERANQNAQMHKGTNPRSFLHFCISAFLHFCILHFLHFRSCQHGSQRTHEARILVTAPHGDADEPAVRQAIERSTVADDNAVLGDQSRAPSAFVSQRR